MNKQLFFTCLVFSALLGVDEKIKMQKPVKKEEIKPDYPQYQVQEYLKPTGLKGISEGQIDDHFQLYRGYVKQVNQLCQDLHNWQLEGKGDSLAYADRRRRFGFEFNGMVLHEFYFANLKANIKIPQEGKFYKAVEKTWGSFDLWKKDFIATGKTRGIGWAILCIDNRTGNLLNIFVADHEVGMLVDITPLVVLDVWEHAYMVDHNAQGRPLYIEAFMDNINWDIVQQRFECVHIAKFIFYRW